MVSPAWKDRQPARISQQQWCIANREGIGKLKHLQVRSLWLQQARADGQVKVDRIGRLGHQVFARGAAEVVDWDAAPGRHRKEA